MNHPPPRRLLLPLPLRHHRLLQNLHLLPHLHRLLLHRHHQRNGRRLQRMMHRELRFSLRRDMIIVVIRAQNIHHRRHHRRHRHQRRRKPLRWLNWISKIFIWYQIAIDCHTICFDVQFNVIIRGTRCSSKMLIMIMMLIMILHYQVLKHHEV